jgi:hypothetical protein
MWPPVLMEASIPQGINRVKRKGISMDKKKLAEASRG